jgi:hypothetical protein
MLGVFAEFETNLRKERQMRRIAKAKSVGVCQGPQRHRAGRRGVRNDHETGCRRHPKAPGYAVGAREQRCANVRTMPTARLSEWAAAMMQVVEIIGAGEGNRTLVISLEGSCDSWKSSRVPKSGPQTGPSGVKSISCIRNGAGPQARPPPRSQSPQPIP